MKFYLLLLSIVVVSCSKNDETEPQTYIIPPPVTGKTYSADEVTAFKQLTIEVNKGIVAKWPAHLSVYLADTTFPYITAELDSIITEVNQILNPNLTLTKTTDKVSSSIQVYLTTRGEYLSWEPAAAPALGDSEYTGYAQLAWNDHGEINHGSAFVDIERTAGDTLQQRYLIHHEFMHALGFLGHVSLPQIYTVMFNYTTTPYILDYTSFDMHMMLLLYHPSIKAGMKEAEFDLAVKSL